ncbi:MAG TPA: RNA 2',3'-cyclic phosphodiesterase [Burkholderiaceae bacterium]|nr:RNA 2',3'-cyclic phosphodiesterase [Burkholderiaceae bacterium]
MHTATSYLNRCFIALRPTGPTALHIEQSVHALNALFPNARRVQTDDLHLTLAYLGQLPTAQAGELAHALAQEPPAAFPVATWLIDHLGYFEKARVIWLGAPASPALQTHVNSVRHMLQEHAIDFDDRPFVPHVTVLRHVARHAALPPIPFPITWPLTRPVLMYTNPQNQGSRYRILE